MKFDYHLDMKKSFLGYSLIILIFFSVLLLSTATEWMFFSMELIPSVNFIFGAIGIFIFLKYFGRHFSLIGGAFFALIIIIGGIISLYIYDGTWDGQTYHQYIILSLAKRGWNPFHDVAKMGDFWPAQYYVKTIEILQANFYAVFKEIEITKIVNFLLAYAMFFASLEYYKTRASIWVSLLVSTAISFPIVVIVQLISFYVDGTLYHLLGLYFFLALLSHEQEKNIFKGDLLLAKALVVLIGIGVKGSALAYFFLIVGADMLIFAIKRKTFFKESFILALTALFAIGYINFNPFVTTFMEKGNPFYPFIGKDKIPIVEWNTPPALRGGNPVKAFFASYTSRPGTVNLSFKLPIHPFTSDYLNVIHIQDLRVNGFGLYMPYLLYGGILAFLFLLFTLRKRDVRIPLFLLAIWFSIWINPGSWWARYVPQLWWVLIFTIHLVLSELKNLKAKTSLLALFFTLLMLDLTATTYVSWGRGFMGSWRFKQCLIQNKDKTLYYTSAEYDKNMRLHYDISLQEKLERFHPNHLIKVDYMADIENLGSKTPCLYGLWQAYLDK